jgi:hypothetical protein
MMLIRFYKLLTVILTVGLSQPVLAHLDGAHSMSLWQAVLHFFSDPLHLLIALMSLLVTYLVARMVARRLIKIRTR